jgi:membrane protease YdiL (CAAX protease family)
VTRHYSPRQLVLAKVLVIVLLALVWGPFMAKTSGQRGTMILGALVIVGLGVALYEFLAHALALVLGRVSPPATEEAEPIGSWTGERLSIPLGLGDTAAAFGWFLGAQVVVWIAAGIFAGLQSLNLGAGALQRAMVEVVPAALPASMAASGVALLLTLGRWRERLGPTTFDWVVAPSRGSTRNILLGIGAGIVVGAAIMALAQISEARPSGQPNILVQAMAKPGVGRWAFAVTAVALAPPLEEVLFRGALLGGLREAWGASWAATATGLTFWLLHAPEWLHYWPAALGIGLLTIVLTLLRLRTASLGPSIAAHCAYNLLLAGILLGS